MKRLLIFCKCDTIFVLKIEIFQITVGIGILQIELVFSGNAENLMSWRQRTEEMRKRRHFLVAAHLYKNLFIVGSCGRVIPDYRIIGRFIGRDKGLQIHISVDDFPNDGLRRNMERDVAGVLGSIQHGVADCIPLRTGKLIVLDRVVGLTPMCVEVFGLDTICDLTIDCSSWPHLHIDGSHPQVCIVLIFRMLGPGKRPGAGSGGRKQGSAIHTDDFHRYFCRSLFNFLICFNGNGFAFWGHGRAERAGRVGAHRLAARRHCVVGTDTAGRCRFQIRRRVNFRTARAGEICAG